MLPVRYATDMRRRTAVSMSCIRIGGGICSARNAGLDAATGECITFVDNDDFICQGMYESLLNNMLSCRAAISMCSYLLYYGDEQTVPEKGTAVKVLKSVDALHILHTKERIDMIVPWNKLYRRELFDGIRYPAERIFDDEFVTYRLLWKAKRICFTDQQFYSSFKANYCRLASNSSI